MGPSRHEKGVGVGKQDARDKEQRSPRVFPTSGLKRADTQT